MNNCACELPTIVISLSCLMLSGSKRKASVKFPRQNGSTLPISRSAGPTPATGSVDKRYSPVNNNQQRCSTAGCGDLGAQNISRSMIRFDPVGGHLRAREGLPSPIDRRSSASSQSSAPAFNATLSLRTDPTVQRCSSPLPLPPAAPVIIDHDPVTCTAQLPPRAPSVQSTSSRVTTSRPPSLVNGGPGPGYRLNVSTQGSLV